MTHHVSKLKGPVIFSVVLCFSFVYSTCIIWKKLTKPKKDLKNTTKDAAFKNIKPKDKEKEDLKRRLANSPLCLILDVGSSSVRCNAFTVPEDILVDSPWRLEPCAAQIQRSSLDMLGQADPVRLFQSVVDVITCCLRHLRTMGVANRIEAIGFACFGGTLVGLDQSCNPVTPVYTYADCNPTTQAYSEQLKDRLKQEGVLEELFQRTGTPIHSAYALAQLYRLQKEDPGLWAHVHKWQTLVGLIVGRLTGQGTAPVSYCEASWTGLLNFRNCEWDPLLIELLHISPGSLPELCDSHCPVASGLDLEFVELWPELEKVKIFPGMVDGAAASIGSKCVDKTRLAVTIGTSAAMRVFLHIEELAGLDIPFGLWCYRVDSTTVVIGGALTDGGSLIQWMLDLFTNNEEERSRLMEAAALKLQDKDRNLLVFPCLSGERAPGWNDTATASILGIRRGTSASDIIAAGMESVCFRLKTIYQLIEKCVSMPEIVVASGAALYKSFYWRQLLADTLQIPVVLEEDCEATSLGIALWVSFHLHKVDQVHTAVNSSSKKSNRHHLPSKDLRPISVVKPALQSMPSFNLFDQHKWFYSQLYKSSKYMEENLK